MVILIFQDWLGKTDQRSNALVEEHGVKRFIGQLAWVVQYPIE
jgi:hypothetical protein